MNIKFNYKFNNKNEIIGKINNNEEANNKIELQDSNNDISFVNNNNNLNNANELDINKIEENNEIKKENEENKILNKEKENINREVKNETKFKKINIIKNNILIKDNNSDDDFTRPNFLNLYKNEEIGLSKQRIDLKDCSDNKIFYSNDKKEEEKNKNLLNNQNDKSNLTFDIKNEKSNDDINAQNYNFLTSMNNTHIISDNKEIRKKVIISKKTPNINKVRKKSSLNEDNAIYLNKKKNNIHNNCNRAITNQTIPARNYEDKLSKEIINTDDRKNIKKIINKLYTPKKLEKESKLRINKKIEKSLTNQRAKNIFLKYNNFTTKSNNLINYSLSSTYINNKDNISSNYNNNINSNNNNKNYNKKRNITLDKFKTTNFQKDNYCTSIEKKRKALGLQFKPDLEKELNIQSDNIKDKILYNKFNNYNQNKRNIFNNIISQNKLIKVNKKDENSLNIEGINATPQRYRVFKKNLENKNRHVFMKNKTSTNFNYKKNTINSEIKNNINEIKNKNKNYKKKIYNIHSNYTLSENNNNSISQMTDSNMIFITNNSINNN